MIDAIHQARPNYSIESIKGTVAKTLRLVTKNETQKEFSTEKRFVKNTSGRMPRESAKSRGWRGFVGCVGSADAWVVWVKF